MALLILQPMLANGAEVLHAGWDNLQAVSGHTVRLALAQGVITGTAVSVDTEALVVDVESSTNLTAYPKGSFRVPREKLRVVEFRTKSTKSRKLFGVLGGLSGFVGGVAIAFWGVQKGDVFEPAHGVADGFVIAGVTAAGTTVGYFAGKARDQRWTRMDLSR